MITQIKDLSSEIQKRLNAFPLVQGTLQRALHSETGVFLSDKANKSKKHLKLLLEGFPQDLKSVKPYLKAQQKNLEGWKKTLSSKTSTKKAKPRSKSPRAKT